MSSGTWPTPTGETLRHDPASISIIIPTFNRADALLLCLQHLERQTCLDFEVILVDDGSTDETPAKLEMYLRSSPLRLLSLRQKNSGPARARNVAINQARSPLCLILGDDIFATPTFVQTHLDFHLANPDRHLAAVGWTQWSEAGQTVTPLMRWLDSSGIQFSYGDLLRGVPPDWKHFYTSNLSVKTELLKSCPFDERFDSSMMEDIELGYRLEVQNGLKVVFLPNAVAYHLHPTDFRKACRRSFGIGRALQLFHQLWPEHKPPPGKPLRRFLARVFYRNRWLIALLTRFTSLLARFWCPNPLLQPVLGFHVGLGYRSATSAHQLAPPARPLSPSIDSARVDTPAPPRLLA